MNYEFYYILGTLYYHLSNVISQNEKVKIKGESQMERKGAYHGTRKSV